MLFGIFRSKKSTIKKGDCALLKNAYREEVKSIPANLILKVIEVEHTTATVIYCNAEGTDICERKVDVEWLVKVN